VWATHAPLLFLACAAAPFVIEAVRRARVPDTATPLVHREILQPVVTFWDASFRYEPTGCIPRGEFEASGLFSDASFNTYSGEDLVSGQHGATAFRFSELHVKNVKRSKNGTQTTPVFDGLFFVADCNKHFRGHTLVLPDVAERALGSFGRAVQSLASGAHGLSLVQLESPDFERAFTVRSTDPTEARYLLSPSLMQRILAFHQNSGGKLRIGFFRGRVYVALPMPGDLLALGPEPRLGAALLGVQKLWPKAGLSSRPVTLDDVRRWGREVLFATSLVDELDLNTRIWSKGAPAA
jgi:hypothetical protein